MYNQPIQKGVSAPSYAETIFTDSVKAWSYIQLNSIQPKCTNNVQPADTEGVDAQCYVETIFTDRS